MIFPPDCRSQHRVRPTKLLLRTFRCWQVMGSFSLTHAEVSLRDETSTQKTGGVDPAFLGLKVIPHFTVYCSCSVKIDHTRIIMCC